MHERVTVSQSVGDTCVVSQSCVEYLSDLRAMSVQLQHAHLILQLAKCNIGTQSCDFLGHHIHAGAGGVS